MWIYEETLKPDSELCVTRVFKWLTKRREKNHQIGVRWGLKREKKCFLHCSCVIPVWLRYHLEVEWLFLSSLYSHWLALWDKDSTTLRESGGIPPSADVWSDSSWDSSSGKKAQYSPVTVIIDVICLSMFLFCVPSPSPIRFCFIQCFIATHKLCRVGIL